MEYFYKRKVNLGFEEALDRVCEVMEENKFGLVSEIPVSEKVKAKLGKDLGNYTMLGFCNPRIAFDFLSKDKDIGVFMPCNAVVYEKEGEVFVSAFLPSVLNNYGLSNELKNEVNVIDKLIIKVVDAI